MNPSYSRHFNLNCITFRGENTPKMPTFWEKKTPKMPTFREKTHLKCLHFQKNTPKVPKFREKNHLKCLYFENCQIVPRCPFHGQNQQNVMLFVTLSFHIWFQQLFQWLIGNYSKLSDNHVPFVYITFVFMV